MYVLTSPMNMAVIAISPKPGLPDFLFEVSFCVYFLFRKMDNVMPQIMQMLISSAIVENACGVISAADKVLIPTCSAAACATWVS